jgi:D-alanyl-D-alanine carboxypeptidase
MQHGVDAIHAAGVTGVLAEVGGGRITVRAGTAQLGSGRPVPGAWPYLPAPHADLYQQFSPGGPLTDTTVMDYTWADAAGAIVSTPDDLDRFFRALISGRLLPPAQLAEMEKTVPTMGEQGLLDRYGLGLGWQPLSCGGGYWPHGGDVLASDLERHAPGHGFGRRAASVVVTWI